jgi:AhpD family alkylhydroperoxidase
MAKRAAGFPKHYARIMAEHPKLREALGELGKAVRQEGPLDEKTVHLIQLAAAASIHSQGSVHSHTKRALESGATAEEIRHALILLVSTIGFPTVAAALSWADDILKKKRIS